MPSPSYVRTLAPWIGLSVVVVVVITAVAAWAGSLNKPAEPPLPDPAAVARALGPIPTTTPEPTEESTAPTKPAQGTKKPVPPAAKKTTPPVAKTTVRPAPTTEKPEPTTAAKKTTAAKPTTKRQNCGLLGCSPADD
ncbi:hypothetical protein WEH80_38795 [Actinomycetes bacterium KLBMP 9759]